MKIISTTIIFLFSVIPAFSQTINETIAITTYYPSPHGVYGVLTMYPRDSEPNNPQQGDMYFNSGNNTLLIYVNDTAQWQPAGGGAASAYKDGDVFYNQTDKKYYIYNSTGNTWIEAPSPGGGLDLNNTLLGAVHTAGQCSKAGGNPVDIGAALPLCQFDQPACPTGWYQFQSWTNTTINTCGPGCGAHLWACCLQQWYDIAGCCTTGIGHDWSNSPVLSCQYRVCDVPCPSPQSHFETCPQNVLQVGCY
jgi:hypothetical protein